jgi:Pyruvate/2-oxoacid:ferredoxin oxidoreductase delta subunit
MSLKPYLSERKCPAIKEMCKAIEACPRGAILHVEDKTAPLGGRIVFDHEKCDGCGLCATACCGDAVEMR